MAKDTVEFWAVPDCTPERHIFIGRSKDLEGKPVIEPNSFNQKLLREGTLCLCGKTEIKYVVVESRFAKDSR